MSPHPKPSSNADSPGGDSPGDGACDAHALVDDETARADSVEVTTHLEPGWADRALRDEVRLAFGARPKELSPRWLYDERGAELFDQITELSEYYPTEAERKLLVSAAPVIAAETGIGTVVELGSGSGDKTRTILDAFVKSGQLTRFVPFDVSEAMLRNSAALLGPRYPGVRITPVAGDFNLHLDQLPSDEARLLVFLGGTIGNFYPAERELFLKSVADTLAPGEWFLLGADLVKDPKKILHAYDDDSGVTSAFILNVLDVLNRELDADIPVEDFEYVATWDPQEERVDMRVRAIVAVDATIAALDMDVQFEEGEELRVEISSKFHPAGINAELEAVGLKVHQQWIAEDDEFGIFLAKREQH